MGGRTASGLVLTALLLGGCAPVVDTSPPPLPPGFRDYTAEEIGSFDRYPLYWVGERFERYDLTSIQDTGYFVAFLYGECDPGPGEGGCPPPLQIQVSRPCTHLRVMARDGRWRRRTWRGVPTGAINGDAVLFSRHAQVRIATAVPGGDPGLRRRVADALRSANAVAPVVGPGEPLPGLPRAVLAGRRGCAGPA